MGRFSGGAPACNSARGATPEATARELRCSTGRIEEEARLFRPLNHLTVLEGTASIVDDFVEAEPTVADVGKPVAAEVAGVNFSHRSGAGGNIAHYEVVWVETKVLDKTTGQLGSAGHRESVPR
jgi:hypothetical protein